jgi:hypothetical protein
MDKLNNYRTWLQELLTEYANPWSIRPSTVKYETIFDTVQDRYMVVAVGWKNGIRVYLPILHLDIIDGKIWLQECATDYDIFEDLTLKGVPKSDIVAGILPESMREYAA